jgi:Na+/proline symporter/nitrogen-specific signal transduction histidine kinase
MSADLLIGASLIYVALLFSVAFLADRMVGSGRARWLRSPLVYTLSISVYCTAWTFYGAVGSAARSGLEFAPIYIGPVIVFVGWWWFLRKMLRVGRRERITSIADFVSSRYGKSPMLAVAVTLIAVTAATPYIALQLQSLTLSFAALATAEPGVPTASATAFWLAAGLALFTILFGTRSVDANERHHGVVTAIALEAVVKLLALLAVGIFVVWGRAGSPAAVFDAAPLGLLADDGVFDDRWVAITFLSAAAVICLPRMFHVIVVENVDERHLATASWAFPLYLLLISLFVLPIAIMGLALMPAGSNPDLFVLTVPLSAGQETLALVAFLGGFSSATSMVIVACIALSTMISNHIVVPIWLALTRRQAVGPGDVRALLLVSRRIAIGVILFLGWLDFVLTGGSDSLARIGLIAFAGVAQILPALVAGLFWREATRAGALAGLGAGFLVWGWTLFLPSFGWSPLAAPEGPFGIAALRPEALFGLAGLDPLVHCLFWSMTANIGLVVLVSLLGEPTPLERLQAARFVDVFRMEGSPEAGIGRRTAASEDLLALAVRILGEARARALFLELARGQGRTGGLPEPDAGLIARLERELAGAIGAASAHAMVSQVAAGETVSLDALISIADETARILDTSNRLAEKSRELEETAGALRRANARLRELSAEKDAFLSQVSHELRTPMSSIRSFAEILRDAPDLSRAEAQRFLAIIHDESLRLTRLLDEILDLSYLESRRVDWKLEPVDLEAALDGALAASAALIERSGLVFERSPRQPGLIVLAQRDRLAQVFINLIANAVKYAAGPGLRLSLATGVNAGECFVDVTDDGPGIPAADRERIFEKFARARGMTDARGAGLGLPISREILRNFGGDVTLEPSPRGARFRVRLPRADAAAPLPAETAAGS